MTLTPEYRSGTYSTQNCVRTFKRRPNGFCKLVRDKLGCQVSSALISQVKRGIRKNDAVLMAIIEVDHEINHE